MRSGDQQAMGARRARRTDSPMLGIVMTLPVAILLWLLIIAAAYALSRWVPAA